MTQRPPPPRTIRPLPPLRFLSLVVAALAALLLAACEKPHATFERDIYVFGTLAHLTLYGVPDERANRLADAIDADLQRMHRAWHAWQPSEVTALNASLARGEPSRVSAEVADLIRRSREVFDASEGRFDPASGHLFSLWGFHQDERPTGPPPSREAAAAVVAQGAGMDDLVLDGDLVTSRNPAVALDFGGIAKGYAGDAVIARLRAAGVENAIFNAGGGVHVVGRRGERPWRIGIRGPDGSGVLGAVKLGPAPESIHTSGNYERYRELDHKRYSHIIDPRTGLPAEHVLSASVIHADGTLADAAATALVVAGPEGWQTVARRMGVTLALLVDDHGTVHMTRGMQDRVELEEPPTRIIVAD